jgi:hypothetical protein
LIRLRWRGRVSNCLCLHLHCTIPTNRQRNSLIFSPRNDKKTTVLRLNQQRKTLLIKQHCHWAHQRPHCCQITEKSTFGPTGFWFLRNVCCHLFFA